MSTSDKNRPDRSTSERKRTEALLVQDFLGRMGHKADQIRLRSDASSFKLEPKEKQHLKDNSIFGFKQGAVAGICCFALLRRGPNMLARYLQRYINRRLSQQQPVTKQVQNSPFNNKSQELHNMLNESRLSYIGWLIVDTVVSLSAATTVAAIYTDHQALLDKVSSLPLVEGRSRIANDFCPEAISAWEKLRESSSFPIENPHTPQLEAMRQFTLNCHRRAAYEQRLRREAGLSPSDPVLIPPPGVPEDISIVQDRAEDDFFDPSSTWDGNDKQWAEDFATGQK